MTSELLSDSQTVRSPVSPGNGYWAGAPGVFHEADESAWYLTYRIRRPRGVPPDRGGEARIARSTDLKNWEDVWSVKKDKFNSASIERCALRKGPDDVWRYFISYVDPADGRWCVSVLKAQRIQDLDPAKVASIFKAAPLGLEGIKDPWIFTEGKTFYMFLSVAIPTPKTSGESHSTLDIFNTGECLSATGLATSQNLDQWKWEGVIFAPESSGWDRYCRRINSILPYREKYYAFYDGSASHAENYEERTGLAVSTDLRKWTSLTPTAPVFTSPHASGSLRYIDAQSEGSDALVFFEVARPDAAHELRFTRLAVASLPLK